MPPNWELSYRNMAIENLPRALIIAIEKYPDAQGLASELPGTAQAGLDFYDWLTKTKGVKEENIWYCGDSDVPPKLPAANFLNTSYASLRRALINLIRAGKDQTSEVYFFFSGHGLAWQEDSHERPVDVLVAADFNNLQTDGGLCAKLSEIERKLDAYLGGTDHYFFIDACRNVIPGRMTDIGSLTLALDPAELGDRTLYRMYATSSGQVAVVNSGFSRFLIQGLRGEGKAKVLQRNQYWVRFDRLFRFVQQAIGNRQPMEFKSEGRGEGLIYQMPDPVETKCRVIVEDAKPAEEFGLSVTFTNFPVPSAPPTFTGPEVVVPLRPLEPGYFFTVTSGGKALTQVSPPPASPLDLYDLAEVHFQKKSRGLESMPVPPPQVRLTSLADAEITLTNLGTGEQVRQTGEFKAALAPGDWAIDARFQGQAIMGRREITLTPGDSVDLDLTERPKSRALDSIASILPSSDGGRIIWISETLGPVGKQDPALLLALIGAGRILQPAGHYSKIETLNLATFDDVAAGTGVVYALFGREVSARARLEVSGAGGIEFEPPPGVPDVLQAKLAAPSGQRLIKLIREGQAPRTWASIVLPNRATFLVFTEDETGRLLAQQFLLPLHHLVGELPGPVSELVRRESFDSFGSLRMMRLLCSAQRRFFAREDMSGAATDVERREWTDMLYSKWVEPLVAIMAGFEMLRRDRNNPMLGVVANNLRTFFGDIPDVEVFSALYERRKPEPAGIPLLRDALMQVPDYTNRPEYAEAKLDYDSPLTSWLG
jgi:hypothetical protein